MYIKNFLFIFVLFILISCTHETSWDDYYRHVKIKPNTPEYNQELDQWKNPWRYKSYEPTPQKPIKLIKKKSLKANKQELKRQAAERVCQKKATQTIVIPHQPNELDAYAEGSYNAAKATDPKYAASQQVLSGFASGLQAAANRKRQEPQFYTQFDEDLFYLCMNEYGFDLEE